MKQTVKKYFSILRIAKQHFSDWVVLIAYPLFSRIETVQQENKIIAFAAHSFGRLHYFAVDKQHQAKGFGTRLFSKILPKIQTLRVDPDNIRAQRLYQKLGFKLAERCRSYIGAKRIMMRRIQKE